MKRISSIFSVIFRFTADRFVSTHITHFSPPNEATLDGFGSKKSLSQIVDSGFTKLSRSQVTDQGKARLQLNVRNSSWELVR
jgi:hypothetical protein